MLQKNVERLRELGPFPSYEDDDGDERFTKLVEEIEHLLHTIVEPISDDDARVLIKLFGPDSYYGLAEHLITIIETAPGWPLVDALDSVKNDYVDSLRQRAINGGLLPGVKFPPYVIGSDRG